MLSIVVPTKNEESYLPQLLASLVLQTEPPFEVIVADANSTDSTKEIAKSFGARVVKGGLPAVGRNMGASCAKGDLLLFLDADVVLSDPDFLRLCTNEFYTKKLDVATCSAVPLNGTYLDRITHQVYNLYARLWGRHFPHMAGFCVFVKPEIHKEIGGFDETIIFCEDHDYARRAAKLGRFGFLSPGVPVSTRRFKRDGYFILFIKFVLAELHLIFLGPIRRDIFHYTFGHK